VLSLLELLNSGVVAGDIGVVVVLVVQLHDLAVDGGLQGAIVVWFSGQLGLSERMYTLY
jgi:hypothetical protein